MSGLELLKKSSAEPPPGARARVWRQLQGPSPSRRTRWLAVPVAVTCALALFWVLRPAPEPLDVTLAEARVVGAPASTASQTGAGAFRLDRGALRASTWGAPLDVDARGHRITTTAAVFSVQVAGDVVTVEVQAGLVRVDGEPVLAGKRWPTGALAFAAPELPDTPELAERREQRLASDAVHEGRYEDAIGWYQRLESRGTLRAEVAMLERGGLELRQLKDPSRALKTFDAAAARFPQGSLAQERELSALDALVASSQWAAAVERADRFLIAFPQSERRAEVEKLRAACASHER